MADNGKKINSGKMAGWHKCCLEQFQIDLIKWNACV